MSYPSAWMQLNFHDDGRTETPPPTTTAAAAVTSRNSDPGPDHGRGARPIRRRSRASRRTPTTLLNTDTTNFRAMVQHFTGSPAAAATPHLANAAGILDPTQHITGHVVVPPNLYPNQMQQRRHVFLVDDHMHGRGGGGGGVSPHAPPGSSSPNESRDYNNFMLWTACERAGVDFCEFLSFPFSF